MRPLTPMLRACGIEGSCNGLRFEQKFSTGLGGPPNLDVLLSCDEKSSVTAIESKFTEPYCPGDHTGFSRSHFRDKKLWDGLETCRALAVNLTQANFRHRAAAQLLKHALGRDARGCSSGLTMTEILSELPAALRTG